MPGHARRMLLVGRLACSTIRDAYRSATIDNPAGGAAAFIQTTLRGGNRKSTWPRPSFVGHHRNVKCLLPDASAQSMTDAGGRRRRLGGHAFKRLTAQDRSVFKRRVNYAIIECVKCWFDILYCRESDNALKWYRRCQLLEALYRFFIFLNFFRYFFVIFFSASDFTASFWEHRKYVSFRIVS